MVNHTDALVGYLAEAVPRHLVGHDPFEIEELVKKMGRDDFSRAGEVMSSGIAPCSRRPAGISSAKPLTSQSTTCSAVPCESRVKAYANGWYRVERTPEEFHEAAKKVVERGYKALKLDPFGPGHYELEYGEKMQAVSLVEAVRDAIGPEVEILLEMHGRFSPATAIEMARMLQPFGLGWVEEPVPPVNLKALKKASDGIEATVATGERIHQRLEYRELFELQAADVIQPDISHIGGLLETKKLAAWADAYYVTIAPHNVGGQINTAAALHLAAVYHELPHPGVLQRLRRPLGARDRPRPTRRRGRLLRAPQGTRPRRRAGRRGDQKRIPKQDVHFNLFSEGWEKREARGLTSERPLGEEGAGNGCGHGYRPGHRRRASPPRRRGRGPLRPHRAGGDRLPDRGTRRQGRHGTGRPEQGRRVREDRGRRRRSSRRARHAGQQRRRHARPSTSSIPTRRPTTRSSTST